MSKGKNKKAGKRTAKAVKAKLKTPMDFDELMQRIVRVKPPTDEPSKDVI